MTSRYTTLAFLFFSLLGIHNSVAQSFAPPVGHPGTTAISKDSSAFVNWALGCRVQRGYQNIANPSLGYASVGDSSAVTGTADISVVSLGDGGMATCTFQYPIVDGPGPDLAVFENGFDDTFLELAFVEVSSDGQHFYRFPARSLTDTTAQTASFGSTDATKINNLAGKYRGGYGTPFDLQELASVSGLNINAITHVRVIDVVGSITRPYATYDSQNSMVNDPWPTAFPSGGFDLDAIGVIHESRITGIRENSLQNEISVSPNPVASGQNIRIVSGISINSIELTDISGKSVHTGNSQIVETAGLQPGIYLLKMLTSKGVCVKKLCLE